VTSRKSRSERRADGEHPARPFAHDEVGVPHRAIDVGRLSGREHERSVILGVYLDLSLQGPGVQLGQDGYEFLAGDIGAEIAIVVVLCSHQLAVADAVDTGRIVAIGGPFTDSAGAKSWPMSTPRPSLR
jgi:hypothetical protein